MKTCAFVLLFPVLLTGAYAKKAPQAPQPESTPLLLQLDWLPNAQFAGVLVAKEKGFYKKAFLDVEIRPVDVNVMNPVPPVLKHANAIGVGDGAVLLAARAQGSPVKAFGTMFQGSPLGIAVLDKSPIKTLADLKGKRIGLHHYDRPQLATMLATVHLASTDATVIDITDDIDSLISGKIDAQVCYLIDETVALEQRGQKIRTFPASKNGYDAYSQVYFCTEKFLKAKPRVVETFLLISNLGWQEAERDPVGTVKMIVAKYSPKSTVAYQKRCLELIQPYLTQENGPNSYGQMKLATWQKSAATNGFKENGLADFTALQALYENFKP
jgi:ABC-type nitrate/sulfonate/bicarbonate transport system substrate-binding protein